MSEYRGEMSRDDVVELVRNALQSVADISDTDPIEQFVFTRFHPYHKLVFLVTLRKLVCAWKIDESSHYIIEFNENDMKDWPFVMNCIDWVFDRMGMVASDTKTLKKTALVH